MNAENMEADRHNQDAFAELIFDHTSQATTAIIKFWFDKSSMVVGKNDAFAAVRCCQIFLQKIKTANNNRFLWSIGVELGLWIIYCIITGRGIIVIISSGRRGHIHSFTGRVLVDSDFTFYQDHADASNIVFCYLCSVA